MKKLLFILFCLILMSGSTFAQVNEDSVLVIPKTSIAPTIDGVMDSTWKLIGQTLINDLDDAKAAPDDWFDLYGDVRLMYDEANLYLFFNIQDDLVEGTEAESGEDYAYDCVELFFDADNSNTTPYDGQDDIQIRFNYGQTEPASIDRGYGSSGADWGWNNATTSYSIVDTDYGWNLEVAMPWAELQLQPNTEFGFDIQLGDRDEGVGQACVYRWWASAEAPWTDASIFGTAKLAADVTIDDAALDIPKTTTVPTIDAVMAAGEWADAVTISVDALDGAKSLDTMADEFDTRTDAYLKWDDNNFYLYFKIWDDVVEGAEENTNNWEWDSIELFFDADNSDGTTYDGLDDIQIRFNVWQEGTDLIDEGYGTTAAWDWDASGVSYVAEETDNGWDLEIAMPLVDLQVIPGTQFGFDIQHNDRDLDVAQETVYRWWAPAEPAWSNASIFGTAELVLGTGVENKRPETAVKTFVLEQNYPNPFNPTTAINYAIPARSAVKLTVFNLIGKEVARLVDETQVAGQYSVTFDAADLPSGIYFYKLETDSRVSMQKMTLMK